MTIVARPAECDVRIVPTNERGSTSSGVSLEFCSEASRNWSPRSQDRRLWLLVGLWLLPLAAGCGAADPPEPQAEQLEPICLPPCKPGPATLVSGVKPTSIALSDSEAYFSNAFTLNLAELDRVPIAGGAKTTLLAKTMDSTAMASVVRVGNALFWAQIAPVPSGGVWSIPTTGGAARQLSQHSDDITKHAAPTQALVAYTSGRAIFSQQTHLLFGDAELASLYETRVSLFGISESSLLPALGPTGMANAYPFSLVLDATNVYFTHDLDLGLFRVPLVGGVPTQLVTSNVERAVLAIDGSTLFFQQGIDINQVAVSGGAVSTFAAAVGSVSALVARSGVVYWACAGCGSVAKKTIGGTVTTILASNQANPRSLAVDDTYVYFGTDTALKRIAK